MKEQSGISQVDMSRMRREMLGNIVALIPNQRFDSKDNSMKYVFNKLSNDPDKEGDIENFRKENPEVSRFIDNNILPLMLEIENIQNRMGELRNKQFSVYDKVREPLVKQAEDRRKRMNKGVISLMDYYDETWVYDSAQEVYETLDETREGVS